MPRNNHRVTLEDVAREAGVSPMTVSRVINNTGRISPATRQHVRAIAERLGYRPNRAARTLVTRRTMMVGFVVPDITNPYFAEIFQGVEDVFWAENYNVLVANTNENPMREETVLHQLDDATVDGIVMCSSRLPDEQLFPLLEKYTAVVSITRPVPQHLASAVLTRYPPAHRVVMAAQYLHEQGHRRIGIVRARHNYFFLSDTELIAELEQRGIEIRPEWCVACDPVWQAGYETGYALLNAHPDLTAIVGGNDLVALGIMRAALDLGRTIPGDLALTGADDILLASQVTPPLTTYRIEKYDIGTTAARLLLRRMAGDMTYREEHYDVRLVVRGST